MSELTHLDNQGLPRMVDVGSKPETLRQADAEAVLWVGAEVMKAIRDGRTPKGNIFETARLAGIMGAKRTSGLIPLCHPLNLTHVSVDMELLDDRIVIRTSARTLGPTGVEMEALTAASVAGLTLYDMLKALSKEMHLDGLRLLAKSGGRSGDYRAEVSHGGELSQGMTVQLERSTIQAAVVTVSDRCAAGVTRDTAGPAVAAMLSRELDARIAWTRVVPDDVAQIAAELKDLCDRGVDLVVTAGGTGISPRDVTPEATRTVVDRELPGLAEAMRTASAQKTPNAWLSRAIAGVCRETLIVNLPGSLKAATENLQAILPALPHAVKMLRGETVHPAQDKERLISNKLPEA